MDYELIEVSDLNALTTPSNTDLLAMQNGNVLKKITYGTIKNDMVGTSPSYTTDTEPYLMRRTAHTGVVGKCALDKLIGGSLGWNQLIPTTIPNSTNAGATLTNNSNGTVTITGTPSGRAQFNLDYTYGKVKYLANHVYLLMEADNKSPWMDLYICYDVGSGTTNIEGIHGEQTHRIIKMPNLAYVTTWARLYCFTSNTTYNLTVTPQIYDLTQMFGSTIADYVYGLEIATNGYGNGLAWLSKYIDFSSYHAYDAGSIQSVQATEHVTLSKNFLTDFNHSSASEVMNGVTFTKKSDGTITLNGTATAATTYYLSSRSVLPTTVGLRVPKGSYIISGIPTGYSSYNLRMGINRGADGATIGNDTGAGFAFTEPEGTAVTYGVWIGFNSGAVFNNVIIRPMVRYATADSTYVPYQKHTYPLGSDTLRGIPQLVSGKLKYDGDEKLPDGTITRKYGIVDLGTLTYTGDSGGFVLSESIGAKVQPTQAVMAKIICSKYPTIMQSQLSGSDKCVYGLNWGNGIGIRDSAYSTPTAFKTAMSGVYLVYELATPTTESSTSYQKVQTIDADGTESFTVSSPVPVGHETQTPDNVLAALGWLGE